MYAVRWPKGNIDHAQSWEDLEREIQINQWDQYDTQEEFRRAMAKSAMYWKGVEIDEFGSSKDFIWEMERAGMLTVVFLTNKPVSQIGE